MLLLERIKCFSILGERLKSLEEDQLEELYVMAQNGNSWFTKQSISCALEAIIRFLDIEELTRWTNQYDLNPILPRKVGVIAAGNIPLVGFHDILSVLISGHELMLKPSSDDTVLVKFIRQQLIDIDKRFDQSFSLVERLNTADAYIATGSDNSARYFQYYFKKKPNIIRANRTSVALLTGNETVEQLHALGKDIFLYYGLGCRNVSKLFVPKGYSFNELFEALGDYAYVGDHHKYRNNYDYNKSIYLVNREPHLDNGFLLLRESAEMVSPISVLFYEFYTDSSQLGARLTECSDKIQCIVGDGYLTVGTAQCPSVDDYADGVDTLSFLQRL